MRNPAYLYFQYASPLISEDSSLDSYAFKPAQIDWTDEEIAAIRAALKKLTSIRIMNSTDVEDLVQETLLTMISKHPGTELAKGPLVWSMGILRRKLGNYYRKMQRYIPLSEHLTAIRPLLPVTSPEHQVFAEELKSIVGTLLTDIPPYQRQVLEMMIAGFNTREIAEELQPISYQNVLNRLYRGRKKLAEALAQYGYGPDAASSLRSMRPCRGRRSGDMQKTADGDARDTARSGE